MHSLVQEKQTGTCRAVYLAKFALPNGDDGKVVMPYADKPSVDGAVLRHLLHQDEELAFGRKRRDWKASMSTSRARRSNSARNGCIGMRGPFSFLQCGAIANVSLTICPKQSENVVYRALRTAAGGPRRLADLSCSALNFAERCGVSCVFIALWKDRISLIFFLGDTPCERHFRMMDAPRRQGVIDVEFVPVGILASFCYSCATREYDST